MIEVPEGGWRTCGGEGKGNICVYRTETDGGREREGRGGSEGKRNWGKHRGVVDIDRERKRERLMIGLGYHIRSQIS